MNFKQEDFNEKEKNYAMLTLVTTASNECGLRLRANNHSVFLLVKRDDTAIISRIYIHILRITILFKRIFFFFITRTSRAHSSIRGFAGGKKRLTGKMYMSRHLSLCPLIILSQIFHWRNEVIQRNRIIIIILVLSGFSAHVILF